MPVHKRTRLSPSERRTQLIELGLVLLQKKSIEDISVEDIAAQAGVSKGLLFHYFGSLTEFQAALVSSASEQLVAATEPDLTLAPIDALRAALDNYITFVEQAPNLYISMLRGALSNIPEMVESVNNSRNRIADRILALLPTLGVDDSPIIQFSVRGWIALVEETVVHWLADPSVPRNDILDLLNGSLVGILLGPKLMGDGAIEQLFPEFTKPITERMPHTDADHQDDSKAS
ncbi:TetR/AcrR family transcriptional regulator [Hoyosella rhizosphaerae]|uniref:TetR family transcriptional regulator n=1 Tax=Hoyosella rhizosphaerae TaxID=1755582 RepID=A0A916UFM2_9ACTN|nr:TetR/AcrR family transcriptional regulator [Hoyosella rhizosphaerae]MBN4927875.1 TetR/AcrR family transcriptional regulator [Hoyosella rhizosphaerae]GGC70644.1 TetR family transcriptional regulator [Hoyosella rhizosphaerae]